MRTIKNKMINGKNQSILIQPSEPAAPSLPNGLNIVGYTRIPIGIGEAGRSMIRAVNTTNIPYGVINVCPEGLFKDSDDTWISKEITSPVYKTNLIVGNADQVSEIYMSQGQTLFNGRYNIGHWAWELPEFPDQWLSSFKYLNEIWVGSSFTVDSISRKSPIPVVKMPYSIEIKELMNVGRSYFKLPDNRFLFLCMYDTFSFQTRKNPQAAINAFKKGFGHDNDSVGLVIKVNNSEKSPEEWENLKKIAEEHSNIYLINRPFSRLEINTLLNCVDSFISLHRAEGFGLVLAEAMYLGKPVIGTNWSGNTEFMNTNNSCAVNYELVKIEKDYGPYKAGQIWADPDVEHAASYMKKLVNDQNWAANIALKGQRTIKEDFSTKTIGERMTQRLRYLDLI